MLPVSPAQSEVSVVFLVSVRDRSRVYAINNGIEKPCAQTSDIRRTDLPRDATFRDHVGRVATGNIQSYVRIIRQTSGRRPREALRCRYHLTPSLALGV